MCQNTSLEVFAHYTAHSSALISSRQIQLAHHIDHIVPPILWYAGVEAVGQASHFANVLRVADAPGDVAVAAQKLVRTSALRHTSPVKWGNLPLTAISLLSPKTPANDKRASIARPGRQPAE